MTARRNLLIQLGFCIVLALAIVLLFDKLQFEYSVPVKPYYDRSVIRRAALRYFIEEEAKETNGPHLLVALPGDVGLTADSLPTLGRVLPPEKFNRDKFGRFINKLTGEEGTPLDFGPITVDTTNEEATVGVKILGALYSVSLKKSGTNWQATRADLFGME